MHHRLELLPLFIVTRSINFITQNLQLKIHRKTLWTDSQCLLQWLKSKKILTPFFQRSTDEIQSNKVIEFRYVSTAQNPADIASRGCTVKMQNGNEFWWHGLTWLQKNHENWPTWNVNILSNRSINNTRTKEKRRDWLNDKKLKKARKQWILHVQFETRRCIINKSSSKDNIINSLGLQLDEDGIIRCHGRFTNAINMPEETKKPIYLPKKEHWTKLLIKEFHERLFHVGTSHALSQMRYIYWIPQGRATVKAVIYKCGVSRKYNGGPYKMPKLADWPNEKNPQSCTVHIYWVRLYWTILRQRKQREGLDVYLYMCNCPCSAFGNR